MRLTAATLMKVAVGLLVCFAACLLVIGLWPSSSGTAQPPASPTTTSPDTATPSPSTSPGAPPPGLPSSITRQLVPLLDAAFTVGPNDTNQIRLGRIKPLVPADVLPNFRQPFGYPSGTSLSPVVQLSQTTVERPPDQLYVVTPVQVTVRSADGKTVVLQFKTATTWVEHGSWQLAGFSRDDGRLLQGEVTSS